MILFSGCISVDYSGKTFPAVKSAQIFFDKAAIPCKYTVMGKAIGSAPAKYGRVDIEKSLVEKAASVGANAVLINSFKLVEQTSNDYGRDYLDNDPNEEWASSEPGWMYGETSFGQIVADYPVQKEYDIVIRAVFLHYTTEKNSKTEEKK
jgi:hypothetical protein